jgi:3,4-dihydroxy-9,10-secoandrosta-1,3,5(10)-triene-9,17-dione 4,5-dioxygenase
MDIQSFGYLGVEAADPARWAAYASDVLGAPTTGQGNARYVRFDERHHRIAVYPGVDGKLTFFGLELLNQDALDAAATRLKELKVPFALGSKTECEERRVERLIHLTDPEGNRVELFYGPAINSSPVKLMRNISGFVAVGHVFLEVLDLKKSEDFYKNVLGLRVSEYMDFKVGDVNISAVFFHCADGRHHSVAMATVKEFPASRLHHVMIEVRDMDDVGRTYDLCLDGAAPITLTLGKHSNDLMTSFYMRAPNGMEVEYGAGGVIVDDTNWRVKRLDVANLWGHRPVAP